MSVAEIIGYVVSLARTFGLDKPILAVFVIGAAVYGLKSLVTALRE